MRLLDVFETGDFQPLERGLAFPQYYENGDKYFPGNVMDYHYYFFIYATHESIQPLYNGMEQSYLMGNEL